MKPVVSMSQLSSHVLHSAILVIGPVLKEHLYAHLYAQSGYSTAPPGHKCIQYALQQAFQHDNVFCESYTNMKYNLQHYENSSMSTSLPWSSTYAYGYQSPKNPSNSLKGYMHNLLIDSAGNKFAYDDF
ncbi:hypothetical protein V6N13_007916 [Hibiscus sabdariffa]